MPFITSNPSAWLGFAPAFAPEVVARICCRCVDRAAAESIADAIGVPVTHTFCANCAALEIAGIAAPLSFPCSESADLKTAIPAEMDARAA